MNRKDRIDLENILNEITSVKYDFIDNMEDVREQIESLKEDEDAKYWNLPESFQESEKGEAYQEVVDYLNNVIDEIEEITDNIDIGEIEDNINGAIEVTF